MKKPSEVAKKKRRGGDGFTLHPTLGCLGLDSGKRGRNNVEKILQGRKKEGGEKRTQEERRKRWKRGGKGWNSLGGARGRGEGGSVKTVEEKCIGEGK